MASLIDLIDFPIDQDLAANRRLHSDPGTFRSDYDRYMAELPALHEFLMRVYRSYVDEKTGRLVLGLLWFRIWAAIKEEEEDGREDTLDLLHRLPHLDTARFHISPQRYRKPLMHCLQMMEMLVTTGIPQPMNM